MADKCLTCGRERGRKQSQCWSEGSLLCVAYAASYREALEARCQASEVRAERLATALADVHRMAQRSLSGPPMEFRTYRPELAALAARCAQALDAEATPHA